METRILIRNTAIHVQRIPNHLRIRTTAYALLHPAAHGPDRPHAYPDLQREKGSPRDPGHRFTPRHGSPYYPTP